MDKFRSKLMWQAAGLPVPAYAVLDAGTDFADVEEELGLPLFVKPAREGSSIGVTKVKHPGELAGAYAEAARHDNLVLAEQAILGGEYTVGILGDRVLPAIRIEPATEWYDYEAKYNRDDTCYHCPCGLPEAKEQEIGRQALAAFRVLDGRGWGRVDFLMDADGRHYFLEANTAPGMTDHSLVPMAARVAGLSYPELVRRVLELATLD
jgi:D-alanine-D-alanine ligase